MKGIHIFCTSQAATAICPNTSEASSSSSSFLSSSTAQLGSDRAIDRYNPIIRDSRRNGTPLPPLSSHPKLTPKPQKHPSKNRKNSSKGNDEFKKQKILELEDEKLKKKDMRVDSSTMCPAGSTRYLLSDKTFLDVLLDFDPVLKLVHDEPSKSKSDKTDESLDGKPPSLSESPEQVVLKSNPYIAEDVNGKCENIYLEWKYVVKCSLIWKAGVKDFNIDFAAKKVTVIGDVTPLGVLASISKVKNAQLWPPTLSSSLAPPNFSTPRIQELQRSCW